MALIFECVQTRGDVDQGFAAAGTRRSASIWMRTSTLVAEAMASAMVLDFKVLLLLVY
jgi:hypothetical protein